MESIRTPRGWVLALVLAGLVFALVACGGSDGPPAPGDAMADGGADAMADGGADAMADGGADAMADGGADAMTDGAADAMADGMTDAAADATSDGAADAMADAASDATADATPDAGGAVCGDRIFEAPEECEDGNTMNGDGCDSMCRRELSPTCGDSNVDLASGEQCDDGGTMNGDGCDSTCQLEATASCGDGALDLAVGEQCDDGNVLPGDGCSPTCLFELVGAFCGDSMMDVGEVCDDGNLLPGDSCSPTCNFINTTRRVIGLPGVSGAIDGDSSVATIGGWGSLATDATSLWFGDSNNRVLRRIDIATSTITTVAGDGTMGSRDHAMGSMARFRALEAITTDGATLWVADGGRIRSVDISDAAFPVTTVAGGGTAGCVDGAGAAARFGDLRGVTYHAGLVYFVDANCATVRVFDPSTSTVTTLAGSPMMTGSADGVGPAARFTSPRYIASNGSGLLYIADTNGALIRVFNTTTNEVTTFAGDGTQGVVDGVGAAARIHRPRGMTSDGTSIYFTEFNQHVIRQGVMATQSVTTMIGTASFMGYIEGTGSAARTQNPFSMAYHHPSRTLFFLDGGNNVIRRIR